MDYSIEEKFVKTFIRKSRQERLLYELSTPEKRYRGISRFCHQAREFIDPNKILLQGSNLENDKDFIKFVEKHDENCLVLSPEFYMDERFMYLKDAVKQATVSLDAILIIADSFAIVFSEPEKGGREKYLLCEKQI